MRAVEVCAHHAHALAVAPIELAACLIEVDLFRRVSDALRDNDPAIPAVEVGALDRAVVEVGNTHVGPIDMTRLRIHDDAVGQMAIGDDGLFVGPVRIHRVDAAGVEFENEQAASRSLDAGCGASFCILKLGHVSVLSFLELCLDALSPPAAVTGATSIRHRENAASRTEVRLTRRPCSREGSVRAPFFLFWPAGKRGSMGSARLRTESARQLQCRHQPRREACGDYL